VLEGCVFRIWQPVAGRIITGSTLDVDGGKRYRAAAAAQPSRCPAEWQPPPGRFVRYFPRVG
jgi:hypothetical protein